MNRLSDSGTDLGMVCDAYGLPHDAVALARHLASNAELDHAVMTETNRLLAARLASVEALADEWERESRRIRAAPVHFRGLAEEAEARAKQLRAVLGSDAHTEQKGKGDV